MSSQEFKDELAHLVARATPEDLNEVLFERGYKLAINNPRASTHAPERAVLLTCPVCDHPWHQGRACGCGCQHPHAVIRSKHAATALEDRLHVLEAQMGAIGEYLAAEHYGPKPPPDRTGLKVGPRFRRWFR